MLIIDAHEDIAYNALELGRDIRVPVLTTRRREARKILQVIGTDKNAVQHTQGSPLHREIAMSGLPELRRGGFGVIFGVIFALPDMPGYGGEGTGSQIYHNTEEAYRIGQEQLNYYRQLAEEPGITLIGSQQDLQEVLMAWEHTKENDPEHPLGLVPLMEGADPIRTPDEVETWFREGLRIVGPAWSRTRYAGGNFMPGPLTPAGKVLLHEMDRVGLILDTTHLSEESFWQALKLYHGPVIASHSNCRALTMSKFDEHTRQANGQRHLSDDQIRALLERDAVIGVVPCNAFLDATWTRENRFDIGLDLLVRHIDHICQLAGDALHVGLGSDIDGGFGRDETPLELDTVADLAKLADLLRSAGYREDDVISIMGGNWRRFLERALPPV
jgi:membrane dipeptidase